MLKTRETRTAEPVAQRLRIIAGETELCSIALPLEASAGSQDVAAQLRAVWQGLDAPERLRICATGDQAFRWAHALADQAGPYARSLWAAVHRAERLRLRLLAEGFLFVHELGVRWPQASVAFAASVTCDLATTRSRLVDAPYWRKEAEEPPEPHVAAMMIARLDNIEALLASVTKHLDAAGVVRVRQGAQAVVRTNSTIMFVGPSGVGKSTLASGIAELLGKRCVVQDCGRLSGENAESALFGHTRGAFTGAHSARKGKLRSAHEAVLFLDEVQNLAPETKNRLLDALERKRFTPLGSDVEEEADFRLFTATSDPIGDVRSRLYDPFWNRVARHIIELPRWKDRPHANQVAILDELLRRVIERCSLSKTNHSSLRDVVRRVLARPLGVPGEIRQLDHHLEELVLLAEDRDVTERDVFETCLLGVQDPSRTVDAPPPRGEHRLVDVARDLQGDLDLEALARAALPKKHRENPKAAREQVRRGLGKISIKKLKEWRDAGEL